MASGTSRAKWFALSLLLVGVVAMAVFALRNPQKGKGEIKIGAVLPLTGKVAFLGQPESRGLQLAVDKINASGGISGRKLTLVLEDSQGDPKMGVAAAQKLINTDQVEVIISSTSKVTRALLPVVDQSKKVLVAVCSDIDITKESPWAFRIYENFGIEQRILAHYIASEKVKTVFVLRTNDATMKQARDVFESKATGLGIKIVGEETYALTDRDFRNQLVKVRQSGAQGVLILGYGAEFPLLVGQMREAKIPDSMRLFGIYMFLSKGARAQGTDIYKGIKFASFATTPDSAGLADFYQKYEARYNERPGEFIDYLYMYDIVGVIAKAMNEHGTQAEQIKAGLLSVKDYKGLSGSITVLPDRDTEVPMAIAEYDEKGKVHIVWTEQ